MPLWTTTSSPVKVRSLTTIGTPWQGSYLSEYANGTVPLTDCLGDKFCEGAMKTFKDRVLQLMAGSGREVNQAFLMGKDGWNEFQSGVLDKIPVVLIAGQKFTKPGRVNPAVWPNDGIVALQSALAKNIGEYDAMIAAMAGVFKDATAATGLRFESPVLGRSDFEHLEVQALKIDRLADHLAKLREAIVPQAAAHACS